MDVDVDRSNTHRHHNQQMGNKMTKEKPHRITIEGNSWFQVAMLVMLGSITITWLTVQFIEAIVLAIWILIGVLQ